MFWIEFFEGKQLLNQKVKEEKKKTMNYKSNPVSRREELVIQEIGSEILVYDLRENRAFCLNETSALVWQACDGDKSVGQIRESLIEKLNSDFSEELVWLALDGLKKANLMENGEMVSPRFKGLSRREVIRKAGLFSMAALPVVSSIIAPQAIHAQSCMACDAPSGRCSGCSCRNASTGGPDPSLCFSNSCSNSIVGPVCD